MTGPSSSPRGERVPAPGVTWQTELVRVEQLVDEDDTSGPDMNQPVPPRPNRATRRALKRAARRRK
ncbi:hypothetical protein RKD42_003227 [Streptomyces ambofaciens]